MNKNSESLALIDWAIDTDDDGRVFLSVWHDYRGYTANDTDALLMVIHATLSVPTHSVPLRVL